MARPLRIEFEGAVYHVTSRGNARERIFLDDPDRERFLDRLAEAIDTYEVRLYLFCLMPNHIHLVLETPRANLGRFMQSLLTGYAVYFNRRHERVGHLTQGRYGARLVDADEYLLRLSRYVHLNPAFIGKAEASPIRERVDLLRAYRWSSYRSYIGLTRRLPFVAYGPALAQMGGAAENQRKQYREFVEGGLAGSDEEFREVLRASPRSIGGETFRQWVDELYERLVGRRDHVEDVAFRRPGRKATSEEVLAAVAREFNVAPDDLRRRRRNAVLRPVAAHMLCKHAGLTQREAAAVLGIASGAAVSTQLRKLKERLPTDRGLREAMAKVERCLAGKES